MDFLENCLVSLDEEVKIYDLVPISLTVFIVGHTFGWCQSGLLLIEWPYVVASLSLSCEATLR